MITVGCKTQTGSANLRAWSTGSKKQAHLFAFARRCRFCKQKVCTFPTPTASARTASVMRQFVPIVIFASIVVSIALPHAAAFRISLRLPLNLARPAFLSLRTWTSRLSSFRIRPAHQSGINRGLRSTFSRTMASAATTEAPVEKFRRDYKVTDHVVKTVDLTFKINPGQTQVRMFLVDIFVWTYH